MPYRPLPPDFETWANDIRRRLEAKEREILTLPEGAKELLTFENGSPLGDTRFLDFGSGIQATLIGDDYVRVTADTGVLSWDAIVDSSITASSPKDRLFLGIGEALSYLQATVGLTDRALVLVRPGTYTETGNWTNASSVRLFGLGTGEFASGLVHWNQNDFAGSSDSDWVIENMQVTFGTAKTVGFAGAAASLLASNSLFVLLNTPTTFSVITGDVATYMDCEFDSIRNMGGRVTMGNCDVFIRNSDGANPQTVASTYFYAYGLAVGGSSGGAGARTWNLPARSVIYLVEGQNRLAISIQMALTFLAASPTTLHIENAGGGAFKVSVTGTPATGVHIIGDFNDITVPSQAADKPPHLIDAGITSCDIAGGALVNLRQIGTTGQMTFRFGVSGVIAARAGASSSGTFLNFIGAAACNLVVGINPANFTGTAKPFAFDAASHDNVLLMQAADEWPAAGTDAGSENVILPMNMATINGHVIEDEGGALTQRANMNFVGAGVTATDAGGKTLVTIPGGGGSVLYDNPVESQSGDVMAQGVDTDVSRADHRHSRRGDEILRLTRMI